jgi:hypothetical protein
MPPPPPKKQKEDPTTQGLNEQDMGDVENVSILIHSFFFVFFIVAHNFKSFIIVY